MVGSNILPSRGGAGMTLVKFRDALGSDVLSFTEAARLASEKQPYPRIEHLTTSRGPLGRLYGFVPARSRQAWEERVASYQLLAYHGFFRYPTVWTQREALRHRVPYWIVPHGTLDPYVFTYRRWQKLPWFRRYGAAILREASAVIFATQREREKAAPRLGDARAAVIPWPVPAIDVAQRAAIRSDFRSRHRIDPNVRVLLVLSRLHSIKRIPETIQALADANVPDVHLIVVGPDDDQTSSQLREIAERLGIEACVHVLGPLYGDAKEAAYLAADGYISLSLKENFGFTVAEAASAELPCILAPNIDLAPALGAAGAAEVLADESLESATDAIRAFAAMNTDRMQTIGSRGRAYVQGELAPEVFQARLQELVRVSMERC